MQPELILTIGCQGSGKSTWAHQYIKEHPEVLYLSTDNLRKEFTGNMADQSVNGMIYAEIGKRTESALRKGQSVLLDATFIKKAWRKDNVKLGRKFGAKLVAHVFRADRKTLVERVQKRAAGGGLNVPPEVIDKYIAQYEPPDGLEFDEIINH